MGHKRFSEKKYLSGKDSFFDKKVFFFTEKCYFSLKDPEAMQAKKDLDEYVFGKLVNSFVKVKGRTFKVEDKEMTT